MSSFGQYHFRGGIPFQATLFAVLLSAAVAPGAYATAIPTAPDTPTATGMTATQIVWGWRDRSSDESGFKVWTDPGTSSPSTLRTTTAANIISWKQTGLAVNTLYSFQAAAINVYGSSAKTAQLSAWTLALTPVQPVVTSSIGITVSVGTGDGNPEHTVYAIKCTNLGLWVQTGGTLGNTPLYRTAAAWGAIPLSGLMPGTIYSFAVCALNGAGAATVLGASASGGTAPLSTVPNLAGTCISEAETALSAASLVLGTVKTEYSGMQPAGSIVSQLPLAGAQVSANTSVSVVLSLGPEPVTVPALTGLLRGTAETAITGAGLTVGEVTESYSATVAAGVVISQNPSAGTQLQPKLPVSMVVSRGRAPVTVPNVAGLSLSDGTTLLVNAGLTLGTLSREYSDNVPLDSIIAQNPAPGTLASPGSAVLLTLSLGPEADEGEGEPPVFVTVPDVTRMALSAAEEALAAALLRLGSTAEAYSDTVPAGSVLRQSPAAGMDVPQDTAVNVVVSLGPVPSEGEGESEEEGESPALVTVPDLTAQSLADAQTRLAEAGLTLGTQTQSPSDSVPAGAVLAQDPAAGALVEAASAVNVVVSLGPPEDEGEGEGDVYVNVPDFSGMTFEAAQLALTAAQLTLGSLAEAYSDTVPVHSVVSQSPTAGTRLLAGSPVHLGVSLGPLPSEGEGETPQQVTVPNVTLLPLAQAEAAILGADLLIGSQTQANSESVPAGSVLFQSPVAGIQVSPGTRVNLVVSRGPTPEEGEQEGESPVQVPVPDLAALSLAQAEAVLTGADLLVGDITESYSSLLAGAVLSQNPAAGAMASPGSAVDLVVSLGPTPVEGETEGEGEGEGEQNETALVPNVTTLPISQARTLLAQSGLQADTTVQEYSETIAASSIISQSPLSGTSVDRGTVVHLVVSLGPNPIEVEGEGETEGEGSAKVAVPVLAHLTLEEARTALVDAGLVPGAVKEEFSDTVPIDEVIGTTPAATTLVAVNTIVNITVSVGGETASGCAGCTTTPAQKAGKALGDLLLTALSIVALQVLARQPGGRSG